MTWARRRRKEEMAKRGELDDEATAGASSSYAVVDVLWAVHGVYGYRLWRRNRDREQCSMWRFGVCRQRILLR